MEKSLSTKTKAYAGLLFVVLVWGVGPLFTSRLLDIYSPAVYSAIGGAISATALLLISLKRLRELSREYFKLAVPTGFFTAVASLLQKIGLQYTTPAKYSFLENLSCITVPALLFLLVKKKPRPTTVLACALCLAGSFLLTGMNIDVGIGKGDLLCALAGIFYGVNIAVTGTYTKKLYAPMYVMIQLWVQVLVSLTSAICMNFIRINGEAVEPIRISYKPEHLLAIASVVLVSSTLCWVVRTNAMKHVDATAVAILMPCSSIVTGIASVLVGMDRLTPSFVVGAVVSFAAAILSGLSDIKGKRRKGAMPEKLAADRRGEVSKAAASQ